MVVGTEVKRDSHRVLKDLADDRWREFEHKTRHEWKLSFSIWAALLLATAGFLKGELTNLDPSLRAIFLPLGMGIGGGLLALHFWFLWWIQGRLQLIREDMWQIYTKRWNAEGLDTEKTGTCCRSRANQPTLWVQLGITALLSMVLLMALAMATSKPGAAPGDAAQHGTQQLHTTPPSEGEAHETQKG